MPFREAHAVVGRMVAYAIGADKALDEFTMDEFRACSDMIEEDIYQAIDLKTCVAGRKITGGPAKEAVSKTISAGKEFMKAHF